MIFFEIEKRTSHIENRLPVGLRLLARLALLVGLGGCAAVTNPIADPVPVRHVPQELLAPSKANEQTIPLSFLGQPPVKTYRLDAGDVLGIYIDGFLGDRNLPLPLHVSPPVQIRDQRRLSPALGYPVTVQEDGTIALPSVPPIMVKGLSLNETREAIRKVYLDKELIRPEADRISVTLLQGRQYDVIVMRQESQNFGSGIDGYFASSKRGTGTVVQLQAYENDVLHALAQTGGLPGIDTHNEVVILRQAFRDEADRELLRKRLEALPADCSPLKFAGLGGQVIRIPLRQQAGAPVNISPEDVILHTGDIVFLEAREDQWYYTAGLLPPARHLLPRDRDLDVLEAISDSHGPLLNGGINLSNLTGTVIAPGLGIPSPSLLLVIRKVPGRGQVAIRVDLRRAFNDPRERILVQPGDLLILQEKPNEALVRYITQSFLNFEVVWRVFQSSNSGGFLTFTAPDRLFNRLTTINANVP